MRTTLILILTSFLIACGGGSKAPERQALDPQNTIVNKLDATVQSVNANGVQTNTFEAGDKIFFRIEVVRKTQTFRNGVLVSETSETASNQIVDLSTSGGVISPDNGRVLTDANGIAFAEVVTADVSGAFTLDLSGSATGLDDLDVSYNFAIEAAPAFVLSVQLFDPNGIEIVNPLVTAGETFRVLATLLPPPGSQGVDVPTSIIAFSTDGGLFNPSNGSVITDENDQAAVQVTAGFVTGVFILKVSTTVQGNEVAIDVPFSVQAPDVLLGSLDPFVPGVITVGQTTISANGTTSLALQLRDSNNELFTQSARITFTSDCLSQGRSEVSSPVFTVNGIARSTYRSLSCEGTDNISATADVQGILLPTMASAQINVSMAELGSISFESADPERIGISSSASAGLPQQSIVTFKVTDEFGNPAANASVQFELTNLTGGITLGSLFALSDVNGLVSTTVRSGQVATITRVKATIQGSNLATLSNPITVTTGLPDDDSFSLSVTTFAPEGLNFDGKIAGLIIRAADLANNPVPDGTQILFTTEGGSVTPSCLTTNGVCEVDWTSQDPRPFDGRTTVVVRTVGVESFRDLNANGVFDAGEPFTDLPEVFFDDNENGIYDAGIEIFSDFNANGQYDFANGIYNGVSCATGVACGGPLEIQETVVLVMAGSNAVITVRPEPISLSPDTTSVVRVEISDINGNNMPAGTQVEFTTTNGTIETETSFEIGDTNAPGPAVLLLTMKGDDMPDVGVLRITVTTPMDVVTTRVVQVFDDAACGFSPAPPGCN